VEKIHRRSVAVFGFRHLPVIRGSEFRETVRYSLQGAALTFVFIAP